MTSQAQTLRDFGLRATAARLLILSTLERQARPLSVERLWKRLRSQMDRVTVYRSAEALAKAGLLQTVELGHGHVHYEVNDPYKHHHHLVCDNCGTIQDVTVAGEGQLVKNLERRHRFQSRSHSFEMFGLCANCQPR